jgi:hypothetical protein
MDPVTMVSILSMMAAAVWTVWTWTADHQEQRQLHRDQAAALYVNPYILVIGELNRRVRELLEGDDLARAKQDRPGPHEMASPFAIETLYVLGLYFGWSNANLRYGPYTRDREVLDCFRHIVRVFASHEEFADDVFHFSLPEQASFGASMMRRVTSMVGVESGHHGAPEFSFPEFAAITLHEFQHELHSPDSKAADLYRSPTIRRILEAVDGADRPERLRGRDRLAMLPPLLTRLNRHLQRKERIELAAHEPRAEPAETDTEHASGAAGNGSGATTTVSASVPEILYRTKGRMRLRVARLRDDETFAAGLGGLIRQWKDVDEVTVNPSAASIDIRHHANGRDADFRARFVEAIATASGRNNGQAAPSRAHGDGPRPRRRRAAARRRSR